MRGHHKNRHVIWPGRLNILTAIDGHQLLGPALWSVTDGPNLTFSPSGEGCRARGLKTSSRSDGCFSVDGDTEDMACQSRTLSDESERASSGMPDMSPMRQANLAGQAEPAGRRWSLERGYVYKVVEEMCFY
ncbi:unnamed protein product [Pleuronectes platessa]|uniref:Uncharacterized protein n=1 Tax=Pleuronectes platessa TaxID=8262 RepID=A0A9N7YBF4_PLEPL|nr:unnamed protein product [Pleuronectes platessa]